MDLLPDLLALDFESDLRFVKKNVTGFSPGCVCGVAPGFGNHESGVASKGDRFCADGQWTSVGFAARRERICSLRHRICSKRIWIWSGFAQGGGGSAH